MKSSTLIDIITGIVIVALVYMIVRDEKAQRVIRSVGDLFSGSIRALYGA